MDLKTFLLGLAPSEREPFAVRCGSTFNRLRQIAYGNEPGSPELAVAVDRESKGAVTYDSVNDAWEARDGAKDKRRRIPMDWGYLQKKMTRAPKRRRPDLRKSGA